MATTEEDHEQLLLLERLLARIVRDEERDCWLWSGACTGAGYGALWLDGKTKSTHRVVAVLFLGLDPTSGLYVLHSCDTPSCCNPNHLRLGSHQDNMADASAKGRMSKKLKPADVLEIRRLRAEGQTQQDLANRFGVSRITIRHIERRETWRHLDEEQVPSPTSALLGDGDESLAESA